MVFTPKVVGKTFLVALLFLAGLSAATNFNDPLEMSKAPTWQARRDALHAVLLKYHFPDPELRTGIVQLFNRETDDPKWEEEAEFDDFNDYYDQVSELCQHVAQTYHQPSAWRSLVFSVYNPGSKFGRWLVAQPETLPLFLEMSKSSDNPGLASQGLQMLGEMLEFCQGSSTPQCLQVAKQRSDILASIRQVAVSEANDAGGAILALGKCGDLSDIRRWIPGHPFYKRDWLTLEIQKESTTCNHSCGSFDMRRRKYANASQRSNIIAKLLESGRT